MPTYVVEDPQTKLTVELDGDSPPTESELVDIFSKLAPKQPSLLSRVLNSQANPDADPWSQWGRKMEVEPGSFNEAFKPPEAVKKAIDAAIPSFQAPTPEVAQLIQMAGLEPARQAAAEVSERIRGALGTVLSPGGVGLAVAAPMAPGLVGGVIATTAAPGVIQGAQEAIQGVKEGSAAKVAGGLTDVALSGTAVVGGGLGVAKSAMIKAKAPLTAEAVETTAKSTLVPPERRLMAPRTRMPEFTESTIEPNGPPLKRLPAPGESEGSILLSGSEIGPRTEGYRISLPVESETAARAREVWSKPIDVEAQVEGIDALRQVASIADEEKIPGKPYKPPTVNTDLRQLERVMQRNTVSKVESWANEVLDRKMREVGANPFFDPEFLAAASVKGAILVKRGVVNFADWADEMRKQFGRGMDDRLPAMFKQAMDAYAPVAPIGGTKDAIQVRSVAQVPVETPPEAGAKVGAQVRAGQEPSIPQKPSEQLGEQVPPKEPLGDVKQPGVPEQLAAQAEAEVIRRDVSISKENLPNIIGRDPTGTLWERRGPNVEAKSVDVTPLMDKYESKFLRAYAAAPHTNPRGPTEGLLQYRDRIKKTVPVSDEDATLLRQIIDGLKINHTAVLADLASERSPRTKRLLQMDAQGVLGWITYYRNELERVLKNKPAQIAPEQAPVSPAPAAAAVSEAETPGAATPEVPPAIRETTLTGQNIQPDPFSRESLLTPASSTVGLTAPSSSVNGMLGALKSALRKFGTSRGHLPEEVYALKKELDAAQSATQHSLKVSEKALMDALADTYGLSRLDLAGGGSRKIPPAAVQAMDAYLKGGPGNAIPHNIRSVLDTMRAEIDGASQNVIDTLTAQAGKFPQGSARHKAITDLIDKIRGNMDVYVHRSYKYFDDSRKAEQWYSDLPHSIRTAAEDYLMTNSPTPLTRDEAISTVERWLSDLKDSPDFGSSKLGSKDISIFMQRKSIPQELRAVLGEYRSPLVNYAKSVSKASNWVAKQRFLNEVKDRGMGRFLFEDDAAPPGFPAKIAGDTSETMSPLNGLRTTHEIADAFREFDAQPEYGTLAHLYLMANAWTKSMATTHSIMTQARNLASRPLMAAMAGHWQVGKLGRSVRAVLDDFTAKDAPYVEKLYKLGILGDSARWGELKAIIKDAALQDVAPADLYSWSLARAVKQYGYKIPSEIYRLSDELGNVFGFENERAIQAKIHPNWSAAELDAHTAKIVRRLYPFYSETPKVVQSFRKLPFGPFVTFQYQMLRNTWNGIGQSMHEIRSTLPAERAVGYKRLAGQAAALTATWTLQEAGKFVLGISSQQEDDFRRFQPYWSKNSKYLFVAKDKGELTAINLSFLDPYSGITDPVVAITSALRTDKDPFEIFAEVMKESANPWVSEQMLANALIEARNGKTDTGRDIVNKTDDPLEAFQKRVAHVLKVFEPGTLQRFQKRILPAIRNEQPVYGRKLEVGPEIARELSGFAVEKFNFKTGLAFRSRDFVQNDQAAESIFHQIVSRTETTTPDDLLAAYQSADSRRLTLWKEMRKDLMAALRNGVPLEEAQKTMVARGMTKSDVAAISAGRYVPMPISEQTASRAKERNRTLPVKAIGTYAKKAAQTSLDE